MPSLPNVPRVVRVDFHMSLGADTNAQCRAFFQYTGVLSQADAQTWVNAIEAAWATNIVAQQTNIVTLTSTVLTDLTGPSNAQATNTTTATGSAVGPALPAGTALVLKRRIGRRFRGGHPRVYVPGISGGQLSTAQTWAPAYLGTFTTAYNAFITAALAGCPAAAAPATEVQVSYFQGFTNRVNASGRSHPVPNQRVAPLIDLVLSHSVNPKVASQRRRNLQSP